MHGRGPSVGAGPDFDPPQHHRENEQLCRLKQRPLVSQNKRCELPQKHAPPPPTRRPAALVWQQEGGFFYFAFSAGGQSSPDVESEMLPCFPLPPLWDGEQHAGFSLRNDGGELSGGAACRGLFWSIVPGAGLHTGSEPLMIHGRTDLRKI